MRKCLLHIHDMTVTYPIRHLILSELAVIVEEQTALINAMLTMTVWRDEDIEMFKSTCAYALKCIKLREDLHDGSWHAHSDGHTVMLTVIASILQQEIDLEA